MFYPREVFFATARSRKSLPEKEVLRAGGELRPYDLDLCDYAMSNIRVNMGHPEFRAWVEEQTTSAGLLQYLQNGLDPTVDQERLLLNDDELQDLIDTLSCAEPILDRMWSPYEDLHHRYFETVKDVRDGLSPQVAEDWSRKCVQFAEQLEAKRLHLHEGIEIVHDWVSHLRWLLRTMEAISFLPRPEGQSPAPSPDCAPEFGDMSLAQYLSLVKLTT